VRIIYAGKAHPHDFGGAEIIRAVVRAAHDPVIGPCVTFLPDYGLDVARVLVQGTDIWLNTPRRPREASGTSGQKVTFNGGINLSTLDGWWPEAFSGNNGWTVGDARHFDSEWDHDQNDHQSLYSVLEQEILPLYYERDPDGVPRRWLARIRASLKSIPTLFNSHRMVREYAQRYYWPHAT
jgi:starch phosphorylase